MSIVATSINDGVIAVRGAFSVLAQQLADARTQHGDLHVADLRIKLIGDNRNRVEIAAALCVPAGGPTDGCPLCGD
ncbi:hypothetical protein ATK17_1842 [Branchiibius hedensis]|uniref:Uncharacterized protein n=1 Tax=Branchiibius hedensis TaxID=672460 RepID=A0A2Y8ZW76_9MICO|nr:hypothetical protein [Branchiibius hedensis]PWJ25706.1 hypothetical protein ATK17_1842 [Branchiibius hedensis]SSA34519.1 hypothetical protein SAMN04489750_1842 [Branchiibius hedensis]